MKFKTTTEYGKFKIVEGNRDVVAQHVKKLVNTLKSENLNEYLPVLVNENMEVIDGQHRLEALKTLNLPVNYIIIPGADLLTVQMLNSSSKSWSLADYIQSYIKRGNDNYVVLWDFHKRYQLPLSVCVGLLVGVPGRNEGELIRSGSFVVKDRNFAEAIAGAISGLRKSIDKRLIMDRDLLRAFTKVLKSKNIDLKRLRHKMALFGPTIKKQYAVNDYMREIERVYNHRIHGEPTRLF